MTEASCVDETPAAEPRSVTFPPPTGAPGSYPATLDMSEDVVAAHPINAMDETARIARSGIFVIFVTLRPSPQIAYSRFPILSQDRTL
jgi:hypothetical protein